MTIGIYQIRNIINDKKYIGLSKNCENRFKKHKRLLKNNKHENIKLQNAWNKYGEQNFVFSIIEETNSKDLEKKEIFYIKKNNSIDDGYNILEGGLTPPSWTGKKHKKETKNKIGKANSGLKNGFYNKKHTKESLEKMSQANSLSNHHAYREDIPSGEILYKKNQEGFTKKDLAEKYNCSWNTIDRRIVFYQKQNNIEINRKQRKKSNNNTKRNDIPDGFRLKKELSKEGVTISNLSKKYNCSRAAIRYRIKNMVDNNG